MDHIRVSIEAEVYPTEDVAKLECAIRNIFPLITLNLHKDTEASMKILGASERLDVLRKLRELLRQDRIRSAAKSIMFSSITGTSLNVDLNKQAAYVGHASFVTDTGEPPLGSIRLHLECEAPHTVVEWLVQADSGRV